VTLKGNQLKKFFFIPSKRCETKSKKMQGRGRGRCDWRIQLHSMSIEIYLEKISQNTHLPQTKESSRQNLPV
jgi:hypothetical protein